MQGAGNMVTRSLRPLPSRTVIWFGLIRRTETVAEDIIEYEYRDAEYEYETNAETGQAIHTERKCRSGFFQSRSRAPFPAGDRH